METLEIKKVEANDAKVLADETINTIREIDEFVKHNEYQFNGKSLTASFGLFKGGEKDVRRAVEDLSLNQRKKLKRAINRFRMKGSLRSANRFYHFLMKYVLKSDERISIKYSNKQLAIIEKRKAYVAARKAMLEALEDYKEEKGNFFKLRLANNQKIE